MEEFWIEKHPTEFYQRAFFQGESGGKFKYKTTEGGQIVELNKDEQSRVVRCHMDHLKGFDDCVQMSTVERAGVLRTLKDRYMRKQPYTYVGEIIISVNPFERLNLETAENLDKYAKATDIKLIPPHLYAISKMAYDGIQRTGDQSILISGESGAGKTEACKICLSYFTDLAANSSGVQDRIMQCNPLLEAFGNAKTSRNNNSSRFGKWTQLYFDSSNKIQGAGVTDYLLEHSRVLSQSPTERNYHIFYMLLSSSSMCQKYGISQKHSDHEFLKRGTPTAEGLNDKQEFEEVQHAMVDVTMDSDTRDALMSVVAGILHLGNVKFKPGSNDSCSVSDKTPLNGASKVWQVKPDILEQAMITKKLVIGKDVTIKILKEVDATSSRNTLCTLVYSSMFSWLITFLNKVISGVDGGAGCKEIGLLDIAGFESFEVNSWEQITINLSNEHLQNHFNEYVFSKELQDYEREGIATQGIGYEANDDVLDVIAGKVSIFNICDDVTKGMKPSDETYVSRMNKELSGNKRYIADKFSKPQFTLKHYAGDVTYTCVGWATIKNKNEPPIEAADTLSNSQNSILKGIGTALSEIGQTKKTTVSTLFRQSLDKLMTRIKSTIPHFIRCIKPNDDKKPGIWDGTKVLNQLIFSGAMEAVKIRQQGYPLRMAHEEFIKLYRCILPFKFQQKMKQDSKCKELWEPACLQLVLKNLPEQLNVQGKLKMDVTQFQMGKSKVFCRMPAEEALNRALGLARAAKVLTIQKTYRGYSVRKKVKEALKLRKESAQWAAKLKLYSSPDAYAWKVCGGKQGMQKELNRYNEFVKKSTMVKPGGLSPAVSKIGAKLFQENEVMQGWPELKDSDNTLEIEKAIGTLKALKIAPDVVSQLEKRLEKLKAKNLTSGKDNNSSSGGPGAKGGSGKDSSDSSDSKKIIELLKLAVKTCDTENLEKWYGKAESNGIKHDSVQEARKVVQNLQNTDWCLKELESTLRTLEKDGGSGGISDADFRRYIQKCVNLQKALTKLGFDNSKLDSYTERVRRMQQAMGSLFNVGHDPTAADLQTVMGLYGDPSRAPCMDPEVMRPKVLPDGSMSQPMDPHGAFSWSNQKLQQPLTKGLGGGHLKETALSCFRNALGWMTDHPVEEKKRAPLAYAVVWKAKSEPALTNELYAQVMKQLINNPRKRSELLGWKLFVFICQHAEPQPEFFDYIRAFLLKNRVRLKDDASRKEINAVVIQCQEALQNYAASIQEKLKALTTAGKLPQKAVKIWNADTFEITFRVPRNVVGHGERKPKVFQVSEKMTIKELCKSCSDAFGLQDDADLYSLFIMQSSGRRKCVTTMSTPVWSVLASAGNTDTFLFDRRCLYPEMSVNSADMVGTNLLVRQMLNQFYQYAIPIKSDILALCAASTLNFRKDFFLREMKTGTFTEEKLNYCLPIAAVTNESEQSWSKKIVDAYVKNFKIQESATKLEQMNKMMITLNANLPAIYMHTFAATCNSKANPKEIALKQPPNKLYPDGLKVTIAVGITGIEIYNKSEKIADARFSKHAQVKLMGWGCKHQNLSIAVTYTNKKREHIGFTCDAADSICDMLDLCNKEDWIGDGEREKKLVGGGGGSKGPGSGTGKK